MIDDITLREGDPETIVPMGHLGPGGSASAIGFSCKPPKSLELHWTDWETGEIASANVNIDLPKQYYSSYTVDLHFHFNPDNKTVQLGYEVFDPRLNKDVLLNSDGRVWTPPASIMTLPERKIQNLKLPLIEKKSRVAVIIFAPHWMYVDSVKSLTLNLRCDLPQNYFIYADLNQEWIEGCQRAAHRTTSKDDVSVVSDFGKVMGVSKVVAATLEKTGGFYSVKIDLYDMGTGSIEASVSESDVHSYDLCIAIYNLCQKLALSMVTEK